MAITAHVYAKFHEALANKEVNLGSDTLKVMLLTNATAPVQGTDKYKSAITTEITGTGYTAGGLTLTSVAVSTTGLVYKLTAANPSWSTATFTAAYAVYYDSTPATDSVRPLISYVDFGGNQTVTANTFQITIDPNGIATYVKLMAELEYVTPTELEDRIAQIPAPVVPAPDLSDYLTKEQTLALIPIVPQAPDLSSYATHQEVAQAVAAIPATTTSNAASGTFGVLNFHALGSSDDDCVKALNAYYIANAGKTKMPYTLSKPVSTSVSILATSGALVIANGGMPAREYGTHITWTKTGAGPIIDWNPAGQTAQGYPSDGSPRDFTVAGIEFRGNVDFIAPRAGTGDYAGHTLWYVNAHNCGWNGLKSVHQGYGDGLSITGISHFEAIQGTSLRWGGSENSTGVGYSFADNSTAAWAAAELPFVDLNSNEKSYLDGPFMISARGASYHLRLAGGRSNSIHQIAFDAPDSAPTYGSAIKHLSGDGSRITDCSFKGCMSAPSQGARHDKSKGDSAAIRSAQNRAVIHIEGGSALIENNTVLATGAPFVFAGPNVAQGAIVVGLNMYVGTIPQLVQSKAGQIICTDPRVQVITQP